MAMNCHDGTGARDPRLWPVEGDVLKIRGRTITVDGDDPAKPATVYFLVDGKPWHCGVFYWQTNMKSAEVMSRAAIDVGAA